MRNLGLVAASVMLTATTFADDKDVPRMQGVRTVRPPTIDGVLSDGEWDGLAHAVGFVDPYTGKAPPDDTEIWLAYDDQAIFVAFRAHDSQPDKIVAREIQPGSVSGVGGRGGGFGGGSTVREDVLQFEIGPFNTRQGGMNDFRVNPLGTTSENIAGGRSSKREFRGEWQAVATITEDGWVAEMRIPWAIMNLPT